MLLIVYSALSGGWKGIFMTWFMVSSALEIIVAAFIIFGLFNEEKLIGFEDKIIDLFRSKGSGNRGGSGCSKYIADKRKKSGC